MGSLGWVLGFQVLLLQRGSNAGNPAEWKLHKDNLIMNIFKLKKSGRACYPFPWESHKLPCPWNNEKYARVVIPLTEQEKVHSRKSIHIQIVRRDKLEMVRQTVPSFS